MKKITILLAIALAIIIILLFLVKGDIRDNSIDVPATATPYIEQTVTPANLDPSDNMIMIGEIQETEPPLSLDTYDTEDPVSTSTPTPSLTPSHTPSPDSTGVIIGENETPMLPIF